MANNRIWLGCEEKLLCVFLGKDMSNGVYKEPKKGALEEFYSMCGEGINCDDLFTFTESSKDFTAGRLIPDNDNNIRTLTWEKT